MRMAIPIAILALVIAATFPISNAEQSLIEQFSSIAPAVGALYVQKERGDLAFNCTVTAFKSTKPNVATSVLAVFGKVRKGTAVITAWHCVEKGVSYVVTFDGRRFYGAEVWKIPRWEVDDKLYKQKWGEPNVDMAMFFLPEAQNIPTLPLGSDSGLRPGETILTVGFPLGIEKISYEGILSGRLNKPGSDYHGYLLLQIFGAPGSSGTSIIVNGKVVGILVAASQSIVGLPVIYATPLSYQSYLMEVSR